MTRARLTVWRQWIAGASAGFGSLMFVAGLATYFRYFGDLTNMHVEERLQHARALGLLWSVSFYGSVLFFVVSLFGIGWFRLAGLLTKRLRVSVRRDDSRRNLRAVCMYLSEKLGKLRVIEYELTRGKPMPEESASALIDNRIKELGDWRGAMLARVRGLILAADAEIVETWKWRSVPVWEHAGILCTGETYKAVVKLTFAKGAALADPAGLFNSSLDGNVRRAIDIREGEAVNEAALQALVVAAVALNLSGKKKAKA